MAKDLILRRQDLISNPTPRLPICLVLDASASMSEVVEGKFERTGQRYYKDNQEWELVTGGITRLTLMNEGVKLFFDELNNDEIAKYSAEVSVIAFAGNAEIVMDFESLSRVHFVELNEMAQDGTNIGGAVKMALNLLNQRKQEYKDAGVDYFQPWLVLMTDGKPTEENYKNVAQELSKLVIDKRLTVFPIGIGEGVDMNVLGLFSPKRPPLRLKGLRFKEFFKWLSRSVSITSQSTPGEKVSLDIEGIKGWGEL
ncbi:MAG: VWA domain-containing protein [Desulfobacterales bacterium]|nr:VWA domain-containing protein [Desulfobacterales bacterium]